MNNKYQFIIEVDEGTEFSQLPETFKGIAELLELLDTSKRPMPATRAFNGRMLIHLEAKNVTAIDSVMQLLSAGISAALGQDWVIKAAQSFDEKPVVDENGDPVMVQSGVDESGDPVMVQKMSPEVSMPLSESYFLDFMPDIVDEEGNVSRPTEVSVHKFSNAADWVLV